MARQRNNRQSRLVASRQAKAYRTQNTKGTHMLFLDSKVLNHTVNEEGRITLLHALQKRDFKPVIRSLRIHCFEELLIEADKLADVENTIAHWTASSTEEPFVVGDLFAFEDH